ncbi:hypothetical protein D3C76_1352800 [compost metagenome]
MPLVRIELARHALIKVFAHQSPEIMRAEPSLVLQKKGMQVDVVTSENGRGE